MPSGIAEEECETARRDEHVHADGQGTEAAGDMSKALVLEAPAAAPFITQPKQAGLQGEKLAHIPVDDGWVVSDKPAKSGTHANIGVKRSALHLYNNIKNHVNNTVATQKIQYSKTWERDIERQAKRKK